MTGEDAKEISDEELQAKVSEILASETDDTEKIRRLHDELGYSQVQLCKEFGFPKTTVYRELPVRPQPQAKKSGKEADEGEARLPMVLKSGKGQEIISPEGILERYLLDDGANGVAVLKGMMLLRAAQLMVMNDVEIMKGQAEAQAKSIQPILETMEQARRDMDAAAARAKESSIEIAEIAAAGAAARAVSRIDEIFEATRQAKTDVATVQKPMEGMFARAMESLMNTVMSRFTGGTGGEQVALPASWSDHRKKEIGK